MNMTSLCELFVSNGAFIESLLGSLYEVTRDPLCGDYVRPSVRLSAYLFVT
jgi:hypothetical protein